MDHTYKDTGLRNIKGERWKDLPGFEGYYRISNFGRLKRCAYEMEYRNGAIYEKPEMIIKPSIVKQANHFVGDSTCHLAAQVTMAGVRYNFTIVRLVYCCFVSPFKLDDPNIVILCKDGNNLHIRPDNLLAATRSDRQQRITTRTRFRSPFHDISAEKRIEIHQKIARTLQKQVSQYSSSGKKIFTYPSLVAAQEATGISCVSISGAARGKTIRAGGFIWRLGKAPTVNIKDYLAARRKENRERNGMKVTQYALTGERIATFHSLTDAQQVTGIHSTAIGMVVRGIYKSARGYFWKKGFGPEKIDLTGFKWGRESAAAVRSKPVAQFRLNGKYIRRFESANAAAAYVGVGTSSMSNACRGAQKTCKGYIWKFA